MKRTLKHVNQATTLASALTAALLLTACGDKEISYRADVQPILKQYCVECHDAGGQGTEKSGLALATYDSLMQEKVLSKGGKMPSDKVRELANKTLANRALREAKTKD